jgi:hypothetical protein
MREAQHLHNIILTDYVWWGEGRGGKDYLAVERKLHGILDKSAVEFHPAGI